MPERPGGARRHLVAAAAAAGAVGALAYAVPRVAARRLRGRPDDPQGVPDPVVGEVHRVPTHDRGAIHVVERGSGPPIVLSHGVTLSVRTWTKQLQSLPAAGVRAVAFDHRGHGGSVLGEAGHSVENLGRDVRAVLETLDLRDAVLVGHSMGGVAVQAFVLDHPEVARRRVAGIVLLSTLARAPMGGSRPTRTKRRVERLTGRVPDTRRLWASPDLGLLMARVGFGRHPQPSHVELVRRMMLECPADTRRDAPRALVGLDLTERLPSVRLPTLVVGGTADLITPPGYLHRIADLVPDARLELIDGAGHMAMLEAAETFDRLVVAFARSVQSRDPASA